MLFQRRAASHCDDAGLNHRAAFADHGAIGLSRSGTRLSIFASARPESVTAFRGRARQVLSHAAVRSARYAMPRRVMAKSR